MAGCVVLVDLWGQLSDIDPSLAPLGVTCEHHGAVPAGGGIVGLIVGPDHLLGAAEVAALPDLRCVATPSTGFDHLELEAITAAGAWVTHVASYCDDEVADHAIAMIVDLLRGITLLDRDVRAGGWDFTVAHPRRIAGTTLGIVGMGRIGSAVTARAVALGMRVVGFDPLVDVSLVRSRGAEPVATPTELFAISDVVSLHALLTAATRGMIGVSELSAMARGGFLVNCARAGIVDHVALAAALRCGQLAGAALDVVPTEPPPANDPVLRYPNTIINPHAAFASPASVRAPYARAAAAIAAVLRGEEPVDVVGRPA